MKTEVPYDQFTPEQKSATIASPAYEEAYRNWIKGDLIALSDPELYHLLQGRSLRGDRAIKMPTSWANILFDGLKNGIQNFPPVEEPKQDAVYRRETILLVTTTATIDETLTHFQDLLLAIILGDLPVLIDNAKSIKNEIYMSRDEGWPEELGPFIIYFDFEI